MVLVCSSVDKKKCSLPEKYQPILIKSQEPLLPSTDLALGLLPTWLPVRQPISGSILCIDMSSL